MSPGIANSRNIRAGAAYIELTTQDSKLVRGLDQAQKRVKAFGKSVGEIGKRLTAVSAVAAVPLLSGLKIYADFQQQMATVATMLSDSDAEKYMDSFTKGIRKMAVSFGESTEALSGGLYDILSASIAPAKALDVLGVAAKSAKAGLTDTQTAADAITTVLNSYGLAAEQAGDVSDWLFGIVQRGKTTFAELAPQIGMVASTAASAGLPLDELGAMIATLTRNGLRTTTAIDSVNGILRSFLKPSAEATKLAHELGFEMNTTTLKTEGLHGVMEKLAKLPPDVLAKLFPDSAALRGIVPALNNLKGFESDLGAMQSRAGLADKAYAKLSKTLTHAFNRIKQAGIIVLGIMGEALSEPVAKAAAIISQYAGVVIDLLSKNQSLVRSAALVIAGIVAVGVILMSTGIAAQAMAFIFGGLSGIITGSVGVIGTLLTVLGALLSPMGLIIVAAAGIGIAILSMTDIASKTLNWLSDRFDALKDRALVAWQGIRDALASGDLSLAAKVLWQAMKVEWQRGIYQVESLWQSFKYTIVNIASQAFYKVTKVLVDAWHGLRILWVQTTSFLSDAWTTMTAGLQSTFRSAQLKVEEGMHHLIGLFDKDYNVDMAINIARTNANADKANISRQRDATLTENKQQYDSDLARIDQERQTQQNLIDQEQSAGNKNRQTQYEKQMATALDDLEKTRAEYQQLLQQAAQAKQNAQAGDQAQPASPDNLIDTLKKKLAELGGQIGTLSPNQQARGTFNSAALQGLMTNQSVAQRTANATEETARHVKRLLNEVQNGGGSSSLSFS
jgi:TP901 family phage tail tape measure protein